MKIKITCCLLLVLASSCALQKKRKAQSVPKYEIRETIGPESLDEIDKETTATEFLPFSVAREDGFYEVIAYGEPYPFTDVVLAEHPVVTKSEIRKVKADVDNYAGYPTVNVVLTKIGASDFEKATEENIGKPIAIVIGKTVVSMPTVNQKISSGKIQIAGNFSIQEAEELAKTLGSK